MPQFVAVASVHGPRIVGRREIQNAVYFENRRANVGSTTAARGRFGLRDTTDDDGSRSASAAARSARNAAHPSEGQVFHVRLIDLRQGAVPLAAIVTRISGPGIAQRLHQQGGVERTLRRYNRDKRSSKKKILHFTVTRYAVKL